MKKSTLAVLAIIIILVIGGIVMFGSRSSVTPTPTDNGSTTMTPAISPAETVKVSGNMSKYENDELGFSVKYPSAWEADQSNAGVTFVMPIDKDQVSTVATLQANIQVVSGTCAFPPVTTLKNDGTITVGSNTLKTVSMSNSVQGRNYFDRMYTLQHGAICYVFHFASITLPASAKNLTGSQATQAQNNNKAIVNDADAAFTAVVKSFAFVTLPTGVDETKAAPSKK